MGLLAPGEWSGPWIKHPIAPEAQHIWFRKTFTLPEKAASAFIHVASVGHHELYVNGQNRCAGFWRPRLSSKHRSRYYCFLIGILKMVTEFPGNERVN